MILSCVTCSRHSYYNHRMKELRGIVKIIWSKEGKCQFSSAGGSPLLVVAPCSEHFAKDSETQHWLISSVVD